MKQHYRLSAAFLLSAAVFSVSASSQSPAEASPTRWEKRAREKRELAQRIVWFTHEPLQFLLRRGGHFDDEPERYRLMYEPDNIRRMAEAGVRFGRLYFYKGLGLEYERPNIEESKRAAALMHKLGMKVSLYMAGTMFAETLYREVPEARNWEQRDQYDRWVPYGMQTFRHYACPNEPAYREYLKRILRIGVEELKADEIAFDNVILQPEPKSCRCPRCMKAFREFLRRRYPTREAVMRRFGLPDVDWIQVNEWDSSARPEDLRALDDPVLQEWTRFRCESLAGAVNDLTRFVKSLNPSVAVHLNIKGLYSYNRYWTNAVYHPLFAGLVDVISFDTGGYDARLDPSTGALVSQIRSYKMARRLGASCTEGLADDLVAAVHMAFNYQTPVAGYPGAPDYAPTVFTPLMEFFREFNHRYFTGTENVADVAVLRNWPSMAYSISSVWENATLLEQVLIQHRVPFDLLHEEQWDRMGRYSAVILADQECLSDREIEMLLAYARNGGVVMLGGNTGRYNQWRERRRVNPLLPPRPEGKGRILVLPAIVTGAPQAAQSSAGEDAEPGVVWRAGRRLEPAGWVLPRNHQAIYEAIASAFPEGFSLSAAAPLTAVAELLNREQSRETIVHFINFDRRKPLEPFPATIRKQYPSKVKSVICLSPDRDQPLELPFEELESKVTFTVPGTRLYAMVVIRYL